MSRSQMSLISAAGLLPLLAFRDATMSNTPASDDTTRPPEPPRTLHADIALLQSLLSQGEPEGGEPDVTELLRRLETADGIATGVEGRLDEIMSSLDDLLGALEHSRQAEAISEEVTNARDGDAVLREELTVSITQEEQREGQTGGGDES